MPTLAHVSIHGPTLAVLLQSVLTSERACDGLLFGGVTTTVSVQAHDSHGERASHLLEVVYLLGASHGQRAKVCNLSQA